MAKHTIVAMNLFEIGIRDHLPFVFDATGGFNALGFTCRAFKEIFDSRFLWLRIMQVSAGDSHSVMLRNDGHIKTVGRNDDGQCLVPVPDLGTRYIQVAAGGSHTAALQSDGLVKIVGDNSHLIKSGHTLKLFCDRLLTRYQWWHARI